MQMSLLHDRKESIDVQIRKHQTRLHNIESKRLQPGADKQALQEMVSLTMRINLNMFSDHYYNISPM